MSQILKNVDSRTNLVGQNRLELLLFRLAGRQSFAINVFKVQEVLTLPKMTALPKSHSVVMGVIYLRGRALPVFDLSFAIGMKPQTPTPESTVIVTEYNSTVQAFLVAGIRRIVNLNWEDILPPPVATGRGHFLTAITRLDEEIIEIIDVEKVLAEVDPHSTQISDGIIDDTLLETASKYEILMVDDSSTALKQAEQTLTSIGIKLHTASDGSKGLAQLQEWADQGIDLNEKLLLVITDAEMPTMDGYRLTTEIRNDARLKDLFVCLHTSLSGSFNEAMVQKVGCDAFLSKFDPDRLAGLIQERLKAKNEGK